MKRALWRWFAAVALAMGLATAAHAASRAVTIQVNDPSGKPVAGARVMVAADEMDAVGTTNAQGRIRFATSSASIEVTAQKDGVKATVVSASAEIAVTLGGGSK